MDKITFTIGGVDIEMDKETASKAFEAGKIELESDDLVVYNKEKFDLYSTNLARDEYHKGKAKGVEMAIKDARDEYGFDFEGKNMNNLIEAVKTKTLTEAKVEPNKKLQELTDSFNSLQKNYSTLEQEYTGFKTDIKEKELSQKIDSTLLSLMPDKLKVDKDIALMALKSKSGLGVTFDESGTPLRTINGSVQKDNSLEPMPIDSDFMASQLLKLGLIDNSHTGGKGGGDDTGGGSQSSYESFVERMETNGIGVGSEKFNEELNSGMKNGTIKL